MAPVLLETDNLGIAFKGKEHTVKEVSISISRGEIVGLSGPSGAGKSLTLWSLIGLLPPQARMSGKFTLYNADGTRFDILEAANARKLSGDRIMVIPQNPFTSLNPVLRCGPQIAEVYNSGKADQQEIRMHIISHLSQFKFEDPDRIYNAYPFELSGGQLQRVVVAMATIRDPDLILADEPTTALDVRIQKEVLDLLSMWVSENRKSMLIVSHDQKLLARLCHRIYEMRSGRITGMQNTSGKGLDTTLYRADNQLNSRTERQVICQFEKVSVGYQSRAGHKVQALDRLSFQVYKGEVLGIVGATGSGKSTIAKVMTGLVAPQNGQVSYGGKPLDFARYPMLRRSIQMVFQDPYSALYPHWTAGAYLREAIRLHRLGDRAAEDGMIQGILQEVGLPGEFAGRYPRELSGGERQRIQIARALLIRPELIICDEITSGLDREIQDHVMTLLLRLQQEYQISLIVISHNLEVIRRTADFVIVLDQGVIRQAGPVNSVLDQVSST